MITFSEFKKKEVLDISSGKNLGKATDILFARHTGEIEKIITSGKHGGFLSCERLEIPFKSIVKIGDDAVLVDLSPKRQPPKPCPCEIDCHCEKEDGFCDD